MNEKKIFINGLKINYKIAGLGPVILILHGWGRGSDSWLNVQEILSKNGYKVVIPDLPGFGKSQKPFEVWGIDGYCNFIKKFIFSLNLEKFYLIGHSFGGAVAVKCALDFPTKIEKLFLINAACFRRKTLKKILFFILAKIFKIFSFFSFYSKLRKIFYKIFLRESDYFGLEETTMKNSYLKIISDDLSDFLEKIQIPTIIIWGEKDKIKKIKEARLINKKVKNSKLEIIPGVGHNPNLEDPERLSEIVIRSLLRL